MSEIPLTDIGSRGAAGLFDAHAGRSAALMDTALAVHPLLPLVARLGDGASRRWLERQGNPYLDDIRYIAGRLNRPGIYFLNLVYEWACSTSAAPDPRGEGMRLIRVLDWGLTGIGQYLVLARHQTPYGPFLDPTWPGYAGVLTALAPRRFAAAINQAPRVPITGARWLDEAWGRARMLRLDGAIPAAHLLRRVCERARDYADAVAMLADESVLLAMPALFTLAGLARGEACVIEGLGRQRRVHRATTDGVAIGVANAWVNDDWPGVPRRHAVEWSATASPRRNNDVRRTAICALQGGTFSGAADLAPPVLNGHTVLVVSANAATGAMIVEALDLMAGAGPIPVVIARRELQAIETSSKYKEI